MPTKQSMEEKREENFRKLMRKQMLEWRSNPPVEANIAKDYQTALAIAGIMAVEGEKPHMEKMLEGLMMRVTAWVELNGWMPNASD